MNQEQREQLIRYMTKFPCEPGFEEQQTQWFATLTNEQLLKYYLDCYVQPKLEDVVGFTPTDRMSHKFLNP